MEATLKESPLLSFPLVNCPSRIWYSCRWAHSFAVVYPTGKEDDFKSTQLLLPPATLEDLFCKL